MLNMKNLLIGLLITTTVFIFKPINNRLFSKRNSTEFVACKFGLCQATAKSTGKQCKHCVSNDGDKYCYQHK